MVPVFLLLIGFVHIAQVDALQPGKIVPTTLAAQGSALLVPDDPTARVATNSASNDVLLSTVPYTTYLGFEDEPTAMSFLRALMKRRTPEMWPTNIALALTAIILVTMIVLAGLYQGAIFSKGQGHITAMSEKFRTLIDESCARISSSWSAWKPASIALPTVQAPSFWNQLIGRREKDEDDEEAQTPRSGTEE